MAEELAIPYTTELDRRMTTALAANDLDDMEYWLPVARERGRDVIARNLETAIQDAR